MEPVRRAYGQMAEQYIELFGDTAHAHPDDLDLITRHLAIRPGIVLDVGCGPGHLTAHLRSLGVDAIGLDPVPEFIDHARAAHPDGRYVLGSADRLPVPDRSVAGILAWYSIIHVPPDDFDGTLADLGRAMAPGGTLVVGFFDGDEIVAFDHRVVTAWYRPVDDLATRLRRAGFTEVERQQRHGDAEAGHRAHGTLVAIAD